MYGNIPAIAAVFHGLRAAVVAIVVVAVLRIGSKALRHPAKIAIAGGAFVSIFFRKVAFPIILMGAGLFGFIAHRIWPRAFSGGNNAGGTGIKEVVLSDAHMPAEHTRPAVRRTMVVLASGLFAWWAPLLAVIAWRGPQNVLAQEAVFFSKAAMVTFGGAYAVLSYLAQAAVEQYHWLQPGEMLNGLGLAESTPGPLIMVRSLSDSWEPIGIRANSLRWLPEFWGLSSQPGPHLRLAFSGFSWALPSLSICAVTGFLPLLCRP